MRATFARFAPCCATVLLLPGAADAHALAQRYDLPVPLCLYLGAAGAVVGLSFLLLALLPRTAGPSLDYPRLRLAETVPGRALAAPVLWAAPRAVAVAVLALVVVAGLVGAQNPLKNIAPVAVWVLWWIGMAFAAALIGNAWPALNPWRTLFRLGERLVGRRRPPVALPSGLGVWPAAVLLLAVAWMELVWPGAERPADLALVILAYSALTWAAMARYGSDPWLARGDPFTVFFAVLGRFAPLSGGAGDPDPAGTLRPYGVGLLAGAPVHGSMVAFVVLLLAVVTLDGFLETPLWAALSQGIVEAAALAPAWQALAARGIAPYSALASVALVAFPLLFLAVYRATCALMAYAAGAAAPPPALLARRFVLTLVPIAIAYHFAHYLSYLLLAGQFAIPLVSDPFGIGWDLFGTALYRIDIGIIDAETVWHVALGAIVVGHVVAVYLAHRTAHAVFAERRAALASQYPMAVLMVGYTMTSLWILAQPIVEAGG